MKGNVHKMKVSVLLGERFKKAPSDCVVESQALMVRGGYIKSVGTGVFSLYTPAKRITKKIFIDRSKKKTW